MVTANRDFPNVRGDPACPASAAEISPPGPKMLHRGSRKGFGHRIDGEKIAKGSNYSPPEAHDSRTSLPSPGNEDRIVRHLRASSGLIELKLGGEEAGTAFASPNPHNLPTQVPS